MWDHVSTVKKSSVGAVIPLVRRSEGFSVVGNKCQLRYFLDASADEWLQRLGAFEPMKYNLAVRPQSDSCNLQLFLKIRS